MAVFAGLAPAHVQPVQVECSRPGARAPKGLVELTVLTWNIAWGQGWGSELSGSAPFRSADEQARALDEMGETLRKEAVDLALLQEVDLGSARSFHVDQARALAERAGLEWRAAAPSWDVAYLPYPPRAHVGRVRSGGAFLSRFPIRSAWMETLPKPRGEPRWRRIFTPSRYLMGAELDLGDGRALSAMHAHLEAFDPENRRYQAGIVASRLAARADRPLVIFGGDLNTVAPTAAQLRGFPDEPDTDFSADPSYAIIADVPQLRAVIPPEAIARDPAGTHTFPSHRPSRMLDHLFAGRGLRVLEARVLSSAGTASDHLPVLARLALDFAR